MDSAPTPPRLMLHGLGAFGMDVVQQIMPKVLRMPDAKWTGRGVVIYAGNLVVGATSLVQECASHDPLVTCLPLRSNIPPILADSLRTLLNRHYSDTAEKRQGRIVSYDPLRIDIFIADLSDPLAMVWCPWVFTLPRPPNALRILMHISSGSALFQDHPRLPKVAASSQLNATVEVPLVKRHRVPTANRALVSPPGSRTIATLLVRLIAALAAPGMVNIDFRDLFNLLQKGGTGLAITTRLRADRLSPHTMDRLFDRPFSRPLNAINKALIAVSGTAYRLQDLNGLLDQCRRRFASTIELKWGTTSKTEGKKEGYTEIVIIGIADHES